MENILKEKKIYIFFFVDIMYQIIREMCYFHDMHIAHWNFKQNNIVLKIVDKEIINDTTKYTNV